MARTRADRPVLAVAAMREYRGLRADAVAALLARFRQEHPADFGRISAGGRALVEDYLAFELELLAPVLEFGLVGPVVDYLRFTESVLRSRRLPTAHLARSLDWIAAYFATRLTAGDAAVVTSALARAKAAFVASQHAAYAAALSSEDDFERDSAPAELPSARPNRAEAPPPTERRMRDGRTVLLACVSGNRDAVGLQAVADAFTVAGWAVQSLGADVPTEALVAQVDRSRPDLVALSASFEHELQVVKEIVARLIAACGFDRPSVIVGGQSGNRYAELLARLEADGLGAEPPEATPAAEPL